MVKVGGAMRDPGVRCERGHWRFELGIRKGVQLFGIVPRFPWFGLWNGPFPQV